MKATAPTEPLPFRSHLDQRELMELNRLYYLRSRRVAIEDEPTWEPAA